MVRNLFLVWLIVGLVSVSRGQISPGDLSEAHKNLEGMGNCTNCHTIGKSISNQNCLHCHTEINTRIGNKKGYHATVSSKECVECHKEHHGRTFALIRFDKTVFDHAQVGYTLEGKHRVLKCEQCHTSEKITAKDIIAFSGARKSTTFLGLSTACLSCHKDEHRGQFKAECTTCHTMKEWKPASKFSHAVASFKLEGAHVTVECSKCHRKNLENGTVTQFTGMEFESCQSCHTDPHKGKFKQQCAQCHTVESWHTVKSSAFDHNATLFPLKGKHSTLRCEQCHPKNPKERNPSGDVGFHIVRFTQCKNCHADAHAKQFDGRKDQGACNACHTEKGFAGSIYSITDHNSLRFRLTGGHAAIPCVKCHRDGMVNAKSTKQFHWKDDLSCTTCHTDVHKGQFKNKMPDGCESCHTTDAWDELKFSHAKTGFPLKGKHAVIQCALCHKPQNGIAQYTGLPVLCNQCHQDQHAGQFEKSSGTQCERCHTEQSWKSLLFDHNTQSRFALTGKHETVQCEKCHKETVIRNKRTVQYKPLEAACVNCHPAQ